MYLARLHKFAVTLDWTGKEFPIRNFYWYLIRLDLQQTQNSIPVNGHEKGIQLVITFKVSPSLNNILTG